ncbi:glycerol-1-phosphate dehydrogenase [NAD(P)+] [Rhizobium sp. PP-F2F-G38]|uniref:Sn-glycerol-1-phosphate dehydrogenase n=1 Tax=Ferranicluibacter rubi TaxID=2715133 RepID=A0AA43ZDD6_9HYPH|nr:iron-containing alcohol dehydrogenase [Ferranicluibacter rubi]NHT75748.1 sn-glycerol-1-phosphate dehydrogenase [Ferranicluibacter rubi]PYE32574.1 glycerol-1-phosphate dehydrogenase [NAD(P)+] [Rhizobium sp. PP-WC-1G-195]PYE96003.1 glycerol-1-phosphate dehydrogenase [NAD(P)+] [Rhizobium sp. PP-F2F-G38]TCP88392.1 glycerol-1-phosphate dehydrogenase [NAD(P)+] [Rhizobium sp. PP-CC-2G-626]
MEFGTTDTAQSMRPNWTALIDDIVEGKWTNPETGKLARVPYESIVIDESLDGREADLVAGLGLGERFTVVTDTNTWDAMGSRVASALRDLGPVETVVLDHPHADMGHAEDLRQKLHGADAVIAVGSGTINDLCKFVTAKAGKRYAVFGTAASMNGYTSTTASMTLESGLKVSLPSQGPAGFFVDLGVSARAPRHLSASGFADCLVRSVAQVDWWMSHRLLSTLYSAVPYIIQEKDEEELNARAAGIAAGDIAANGYLHRVLTLCGLGVSFTGMSNHGSMGEHQISHYIDCFAGEDHPGTLHGQQVGVATLTMARLQRHFLDSETAPVIRPTRIDPADMARRMGPDIAAQCFEELKGKIFDERGAARINETFAELWPTLRGELNAFALPVAEMERLLSDAGGPMTSQDLGLPVARYREAVIHSREMRNRYSFLDVAADAGILADFAAGEA